MMYWKLDFPANHCYPVVGFTKTTKFITVPWPNVMRFGSGTKHSLNNCFLFFCIIIDFQETWWGSTQRGNPKVKNLKLKFTEITHQLVQVSESTLHLFFSSLSLRAITITLVDSDQRTAAPLHFLNDLKDQVHSFLHCLLKELLFTPPSLRLNLFSVIAQPLQLLIYFVEDCLVTVSDRHVWRSRPMKTLSDKCRQSCPLCDSLPPITAFLVCNVIRGGYPLSPQPRDQRKRSTWSFPSYLKDRTFPSSHFQHGIQTESRFAGNGTRSATLSRQMFHLSIGFRNSIHQAMSSHAILWEISSQTLFQKSPWNQFLMLTLSHCRRGPRQ